MSDVLAPDLCVIGAGAGGLSVAAAAASMGVSVILIEKGPMGGDCLNYGCVPSKALIAAARAAHDMRRAERFGIHAETMRIDFSAVMAHVRQTIAAIAPMDSQERFAAMNVRVIRAKARFIARDVVEAGGFRIRARRFVVATGSSPGVPNIPGLAEIGFFTNETIFSIAECPRHLVVLGGGPCGLELAQAFARLGAQVSLVEAGQILAREEEEFASLIASSLRGEGIALHEQARVIGARKDGEGFVLDLDSGATIGGTHLLIAAGRRPNVADLGLEAAGIRFSQAGIETGADLRTSNRKVYALGDVIGGAGSTAGASYHAGLVLRATLFRLPARVVPHLVPRIVFTDPEFAATGLNEAQAREAGHRIRVLRWPFAENDRARAEAATPGHIKIVLAANGRILGAAIAGRGAAEMIGLWQLAIAKGFKIQTIARLVLPYPSFSDASKRVALGAFFAETARPRLRWLLGVLRKFG